ATPRAVPSAYASAAGDWVGVTARVAALVYDTSKLSAAQVPSHILELERPQWRSRIAFAPSETDFQPLVGAIARLDGVARAERWLRALAANARTLPDNETVVAQVNNGESQLG